MASPALSPPASPPKVRPQTTARPLTSSHKMDANGHFASVGSRNGGKFEHGIQVIDEDKEFKYEVFLDMWKDVGAKS